MQFERLKKNKTEITNKFSIFFIYFIIFFLTYSQFFHYRITSDHVPSYLQPFVLPNFIDLFSSGPFNFIIAPFIAFVFNFFGQDNIMNTALWQFFTTLFYALSAFVIHFFIKSRDLIKNNCLLYFGISLCFVNPIVIEHFIYHSLWSAMGIFFVVCSTYYLFKKKYLVTIILGYLAQQVYQINLFLILILGISFTYFVFYKENLISLIKKELLNCLILVVGPLLFIFQYTLFTKFYGAISVSKDPLASQGLINRLNRMFDAIIKIYKENSIFFNNKVLCYFVFISFIFVAVSIWILKKNDIKAFITNIFASVLYYSSICTLSVIFFFLVDYYIVARILVPVAFLISMFALIMIFFTQQTNNKIIIYLSYIFIVIFSCYMYYKTQTFITDSYIAQAEDEFVVRMINNKIKDYTKTTGIEVTEIVTSRNKCKSYYDEQYSREYNYNHKMYYDEWAMGGYINLINGTDYNFRIMTEEEQEKYFTDDSLLYFDLSKQLVFDGETVYWLAY